MKVLDLFSGIGGFSLGLERAGMETLAFCEIGKFQREVLRQHWPSVPIYEDIKQLTIEDIIHDTGHKPEVICGGFPCQPFSVAGKRKGIEDPRSLWHEMFRLVQECKPTWVIGENVANFTNMALEDALLDLEGEGYETQSIIIPASAVNAPHRRNRIWIIAHSNSSGWGKGNEEVERGSTEQSDSSDIQSSQDDTYSCLDRLQRCSEESLSGFQYIQGELIRSGEVLGIKSDSCEPGILGICNGFPGRVDRVKAIGNAVVPHIPERIGKYILEIERLCK
jgi:DNA (cytosine-5)-methyltransferase 1